jgi:hypothetical protein
MRTACVGCGVELEEFDGPQHPYMESSAACWAMYGEVLAREYSDPACMQVHRLTVDSYAIQHPGRPSPQAVQSIALHLISLCMCLELGVSTQDATATLGALASQKGAFHWLEPPSSRAELTIAHVHAARSASEHVRAAREWASCAWQQWSAHHGTVRDWLPSNTRLGWAREGSR